MPIYIRRVGKGFILPTFPRSGGQDEAFAHPDITLKPRQPLPMPQPYIAISPFLGSCPGVTTLGVRAAIADYSPAEKQLMASAGLILFPTHRFAGIFEAAGKKTFPSAFTYRLRKSRLEQETLFQFHGWPHPRARIYYGRQKDSVHSDFGLPFIAMGPSTSDKVHIVETRGQLADPADKFNPLIVREKIEYEKRVFLVFVNYDCVAVLRKIPGGPFCSESSLPPSITGFCRRLSELMGSFKIDDIGVEIGFNHASGPRVIGMARPPLSWQTPTGRVNRHDYISDLVKNGEL